MPVASMIEKTPIIEVGRTAADLGVSFNTAASAIRLMEKHGVL